jgi:hypothetical protein
MAHLVYAVLKNIVVPCRFVVKNGGPRKFLPEHDMVRAFKRSKLSIVLSDPLLIAYESTNLPGLSRHVKASVLLSISAEGATCVQREFA